MDKNKSIFKLEGLPKILWLNLDSDTHRRVYMENQFDYWQIDNHVRMPGYDARNEDISYLLKGRIPDDMTPGEVGCVLSHLKAIKYFYEETNDPFVLIAEDDVSFDPAKCWSFTWRDFFSRLPYDWDSVQMTLICTGDIHMRLHTRFINNFSAAAYLISRHHASKIVKNHVRGEKYKIDNGVLPRPVSEDLIFESGKTYSLPIFLYKLDLGSAIHPEHIDIFHRNSHDGLLNFWNQTGAQVTIEQLMGYDPYFNRITEPSNPNPET